MPTIVNGIPVPTVGDPTDIPGNLAVFAVALGDVLAEHLGISTTAAQEAGAAAATAYASSLDDTKMTAVAGNPASTFAVQQTASLAAVTAWAKNPDTLVAGNLTYSGGVLSSADVVWPDGATGTLTITSRQSSTNAVTAYTITRVVSGQPTKTYTQPTITRDSDGNATTVPQITVA